MDALGELAASVLELVLEMVPLHVTVLVCANLAAAFYVADWVADDPASPARPWVCLVAWIVLPLASLALLAWPRRRRERRSPVLESRIEVSPPRPRRW